MSCSLVLQQKEIWPCDLSFVCTAYRVCAVFRPLSAAKRATVSVEIKDQDERAQITYYSGPFRGSEAFRGACRSTLTNPRLPTGATVKHTLPSSPQSFSLFLPSIPFFSLPVCLFQKLVFRHLRLCVFYHQPSSPWSWRVSACTVFVSYRQSASLISPLLCSGFFCCFFFFPCLL